MGAATNEAVDDGADNPSSTVSTDRSRHSRAPMALVVVATVIAILSAATTWVRAQALDTDEWVEASTEVLADARVQQALATYLVDELYATGNVTDALESALPDDLTGLAGPIAGALRAPATEGVERIIARPRIQQAWVTANRLAHETLVAILRDEVGPNVSTTGGEVVLDLAGVVGLVGAEVGLPESVLDRLPEDVGQVVIFESDELADVQDVVRAMDLLSWFLFVVVVALYSLAVYLAAGRRRVMLRNVGIALAVGSVVLLALRRVAVRAAVDTVVEIPANRPVGQFVGDVFTELLSDMAWTGVILGVVIAAFAALLGPHRWAVGVRDRLGALSNPGAVIAGTGVAVLVVLAWWGPGRVFERWVTGLTMVGLFVGAVIALTIAVQSSGDGGRSDDATRDSTGDTTGRDDAAPSDDLAGSTSTTA